MFTACGILNVKTGTYARASLPLFLALAIFFVVLIMFPSLSTALPNVLGSGFITRT